MNRVFKAARRQDRLARLGCAAGLAAMLFALQAAAQVVDSNRVYFSAWRRAGHAGPVPSPARIVNVRDFGAAGNGVSNDQPAVAAAILSLTGAAGVVFFPAGTYRLQSPVSLTAGVVLRGQRAGNTTLRFDFNGHCIQIHGAAAGAFQPVVADGVMHAGSIVVSNGSVFVAGDFAEIRQVNDPAWHITDSWADYAASQIVRIVGVDGNTLTLETPLRHDYPIRRAPQIRKLALKQQCGVENLKVERLPAGDATTRNNQYTIHFSYAANGWVRGVECYNGFGGHIALVNSTRISVTGCYLHHAHDYDGGGSGYGVRLEMKTGDCLVENNIFQRLRHAMLLQAGANGNVLGYNNSFDAHSNEHGSEAGDIVGHGNYPYANLFEGNVCQHIWIDHSHNGINGPYNTFFRNRAERCGFNMTDPDAHSQNLIGNEVLKGGFLAQIMAGDGWRLRGTNHFTHGNTTKADGLQAPGTSNLTDYSYYLNDNPAVPPPVPAFWTIADTLPTIGPPHALDTAKRLPACARMLAGGSPTVGPPSIARQPIRQIVSQGEPAVFTVEAYGTPAATYAWRKNGAVLAGQTNATLTVSPAQESDAGAYAALVSDAHGSALSEAAVLTVRPPEPAITPTWGSRIVRPISEALWQTNRIQ